MRGTERRKEQLNSILVICLRLLPTVQTSPGIPAQIFGIPAHPFRDPCGPFPGIPVDFFPGSLRTFSGISAHPFRDPCGPFFGIPAHPFRIPVDPFPGSLRTLFRDPGARIRKALNCKQVGCRVGNQACGLSLDRVIYSVILGQKVVTRWKGCADLAGRQT
jgi:hypothetical protein